MLHSDSVVICVLLEIFLIFQYHTQHHTGKGFARFGEMYMMNKCAASLKLLESSSYTDEQITYTFQNTSLYWHWHRSRDQDIKIIFNRAAPIEPLFNTFPPCKAPYP